LEGPEWQAINDNSIRHYTPEKIKEKGIDAVCSETIKHFKDYDAIYISFDADSLDTSISV
jgi:arginase